MIKKLHIILLLVAVVSLAFVLNSCNVGNNETKDPSSVITPSDVIDGYKIIYELNGGTEEANPRTYTEDDEFLLHHPTKEGSHFIGWTFEGQSEPVLSVRIERGSSGDKHFTANYSDEEYKPLKIAVFADVQLTTSSQDATVNDYLALKGHFTYAKSIGANVFFLNGDIVNNAVESYYKLYEKALVEVYGSDESQYPEFVMNMGNHEWWDKNEKDTKEAVSLFRKYARIESEYLIKQSDVNYFLDDQVTLPSYYKIIEGVPFLVISAYNSSGIINSELKKEIKGWLEEIAELESVKCGGPIYVAYHNAISGITYNGEQAPSSSETVYDLLKPYPNAVLFTGDTHFNAVNERTISQIDFTAINIGTSSYSRSMTRSATGFAGFNNVESNGVMKGDIKFKYQYTPTMMVITTNTDGNPVIDRFFTSSNLSEVKKIGPSWTIPKTKSKSDFIYTNNRIQNTEWAEKLYGKAGLNWAEGAEVRFNVVGNKMIINFDDVTDFNCAEFYRIKVQNLTLGGSKSYYYMSHYYKYEDDPHTYNFVINNATVISDEYEYAITVTAYDFFENPSLCNLTSNTVDSSLVFPEEIDYKTVNIYNNATKIVNYEETAEGSNSSIEYYFKGIKKFSAGMLLDRVILEGSSSNSLKNCLSVEDWSHAKLIFKVKNINDFDMKFGITLVTKENGKEKWLTDGGAEYHVTVPANSDWVTISYDLAELFGVTSDIISQLSLKAFVPNSEVDTENGYEVRFFVDCIDVIEVQ